ncbi:MULTISPECIES: hypothetical protein [Bacteroides]|jgi:hypothetical protein|nr:hypothetical protein [Bacteroides fragilis]MCM0249439.1 hypothetical protein [Bacteroides fragilis]MCM0315003.1 hypothetical protein [Bacteroides fragilis]MCM0333771.1 hypothetical protein [Bacteroides fragilis]
MDLDWAEAVEKMVFGNYIRLNRAEKASLLSSCLRKTRFSINLIVS